MVDSEEISNEEPHTAEFLYQISQKIRGQKLIPTVLSHANMWNFEFKLLPE